MRAVLKGIPSNVEPVQRLEITRFDRGFKNSEHGRLCEVFERKRAMDAELNEK